ncbi:MAG: TetR/AcrR family transcriptional regulator [Burkholderiales bacterium]|nr:TetR/AcrR family transcriptional regulator [Burkholderiales bacterium]
MKKPPRRTAERILATALDLFNRYGEPNVATTLIASDMGISPGNLFYHFPAKELLVNALFDEYVHDMDQLLPAAADVRDMEHAWFFMHSLFELIWRHRFIYRDLNDLLSKNRHLEGQVKGVLQRKQQAFEAMLSGLQEQGLLSQGAFERQSCATHMVVLLTWWLSYEYVQNPRHALEDTNADHSALRGAQQVLGLLLPYLDELPKLQLQALIKVYRAE